MIFAWDFFRGFVFGLAYAALLMGCFLFARYVLGPYVLGPIFKLFYGDDK